MIELKVIAFIEGYLESEVASCSFEVKDNQKLVHFGNGD